MGSKSVMENFQVITTLIVTIITVIITICYSYSAKREFKKLETDFVKQTQDILQWRRSHKKDAPEAAIEGS